MNHQSSGILLHSARESAEEIVANVRDKTVASPVIMDTGNMPAHEFVRRPWLKPDAHCKGYSPFGGILIKQTEPLLLLTHHEH